MLVSADDEQLLADFNHRNASHKAYIDRLMPVNTIHDCSRLHNSSTSAVLAVRAMNK